MRAWCLVLAIALSGCATRLLDDGGAPDGGGAADFSTGGQDLASTSTDMAGCTAHVYEPVALGGIQPISFLIQHGAAIRFEVTLPLRPGCDLPGPIDLTYNLGNAIDEVDVVAHRFRQVGGNCPSAEQQVVRVIVLDGKQLSSPTLIVQDKAPGGNAIVKFMVAPSVGSCGDPGMNKCTLDCQCQARFGPDFLCLGGLCGVSCSEDADCAAQPKTPACGTLSSIPFACGPSLGCAMSCPFGQACQGGGCRPNANFCFGGPACGCDADCPAGTICVAGSCNQPCVTVNDCGMPVACNASGACDCRI